MLVSGFSLIDPFPRLDITYGAEFEQPVNYESLTTTIFDPASESARTLRLPDRQQKRDVLDVILAGKSSITGSPHTRLFILPLALVQGCTLTACSDRAALAISAEDRALMETAGFLSIIMLAIVGLFGPTVYRWWRRQK
jgi:hypothetical protein